MTINLGRFCVVALIVAGLAGCGDGGGALPAPPPPPPPSGGGPDVAGAIATAASNPANDTSVNPAAVFTVIQGAGEPCVTVGSPPIVRFTVFSDGKVVTGLTTSNARFNIAKLVRGTNGDPDDWVNYVYRTETATPGVGPGGTPALASAKQPTTDPASASQLVFNDDGYYVYTFSTDITDPTKTNGVVYEPGATHRIGIQLSYTNAAGETVRVNPIFDFTLDAGGDSVAVTDPAQTRKVVDVTTCNECHNPLALHGGGRVDPQYCVMCHNSGNTDANSGNVLRLKTMVHKIHAGRYLHEENGEDYTIWGFNNSEHDYSEVGFPANVRNCTKCHDGSKKDAAGNQLAAQGDNWKTVPSKEACFSCHATGESSGWFNIHINTLNLGTSVDDVTNAACTSCHGAGKQWRPDRVHWVQELENTALYQTRIESVALTTAPTATTAGVVTVKYAIVNPATDAAYDLREGCSAAATTDQDGTSITGCNTNYRWYTTTPPGAAQDKFGTFALNLATNTFVQTTDDTTNTTSWAAYRGVDDGTHHYTAKLTVPAGSNGNARVVMVGSVAERRIDPVSRSPVGAVPAVSNEDLAYVPVKNAIKELNILTGSTNSARRQIVSNDKCNACHVYLGIPMNPEPGAHGFHSGLRNNSENCEICHNWSRAGSYTAMTDGTDFNESWQARRMIHGIHGGSERHYPFNHGSDYIGEFGKDGYLLSDGVTPLQSLSGQASEVLNFSTEVAFPGRLADCNTCHVSDSWKQNRAVLGSAIVGTGLSIRNGRYTNPGINHLVSSGACVGQTGSVAGMDLACTSIDMLKLPVISPKASVCTSCHDSKGVQGHVINVGGAAFGTMNNGDVLAGRIFEACDGCHEPGGFVGVDSVHGLK